VRGKVSEVLARLPAHEAELGPACKEKGTSFSPVPTFNRAFFYFFFVVLFRLVVAGFAGAGFSLPPISDSESSALNGNCLTDVCPVVLNVISTRRLLASMMVRR
jgi:hypothetical protein